MEQYCVKLLKTEDYHYNNMQDIMAYVMNEMGEKGWVVRNVVVYDYDPGVLVTFAKSV